MDKAEIEKPCYFESWEDLIDSINDSPWYKKIFYGVKRILTDTRFKIRMFLQRLFRGYADCEVWSFYDYLSKYAIPRLKKLQKIRHGYPASLQDDNYSEDDHYSKIADQRWHDILSKIILAFELIANEDKDEADDARVKEGLDLFREYFFALWD